MPKYFSPDILKFLRHPKNLLFSLELSNYVARLRQDLIKEFWQSMPRLLLGSQPAKLKGYGFQFEKIGDSKEDPFLTEAGYTGLNGVPLAAVAQNQALGFAVEHASFSDTHEIYIGAHWKLPVGKKHPCYEKGPVADLKATMIDARYDFWGWGWICGRLMASYQGQDKFLEAYIMDADAITNPIVSSFWSMVLDYNDAATTVNSMLLRDPRVFEG